jgi:hypothetical protein
MIGRDTGRRTGSVAGALADESHETVRAAFDLGVIRVHLAAAYEANKQPDKAREVLERALATLEELRKAAIERGVPNPVDPPWAAEAKANLQRLSAGAAPAPAAPAEG